MDIVTLLKRADYRLFLISFFILFFELTLIRYIPSQIRYVGFFSNIILLASFVGIGLGTSFYKQLKPKTVFLPFSVWGMQLAITLLQYDLTITTDDVVYYTTGFGNLEIEPTIFLPIIFALTVIAFLVPSAIMGRLMTKFTPLKAYSINILGSIAGVLAFTLASAFGTGPILWFFLLSIASLSLVRRPFPSRWKTFYLVALVISLFVSVYTNKSKILNDTHLTIGTTWSPYYKINLYQHKTEAEAGLNFVHLLVNNIDHQSFMNPTSEYASDSYSHPYTYYPERTFEDVLIIGAGGGNDVAMALKQGASRVTAVEIDPEIINLGNQYHPEQPYKSDRVTVINDDGRSFLANDTNQYDLIVYAVTDSLTLSAASTNLRLESYLFTTEAFESTKDRLKGDGLLVLYNDYREDWMVDKLGIMLKDAFGHDPFIHTRDVSSTLITSIDPHNLIPTETVIQNSNLKPSTDDWPFLYLKDPQIPQLYLNYLAPIVLVMFIGSLTLYKKTKTSFNLTLFFMGIGFMLLETKNVVQFSLLFGSTWVTNAFVFIGILTLVLLAIWTAQKFPRLPLSLLYVGLFASLALVYFYPQENLLSLSYSPRLIAAIILNFGPIFLANLIFSQLFKDTKLAPVAYGANMLGAFAGGLFEYTSLIWGYQNLMLFVAIFYIASFQFSRNSR
jgi:SAM-dependent methyltransferase